jgi:hypothetical protein
MTPLTPYALILSLRILLLIKPGVTGMINHAEGFNVLFMGS